MWLDNLKKMKEQSGMTTKEISKQSGIPEPTLEKLFSGATKDPKLPTMQKLVHFLGYTLGDLDENPTKRKKAPPYSKEVMPVLDCFSNGETSVILQKKVLPALEELARAEFGIFSFSGDLDANSIADMDEREKVMEHTISAYLRALLGMHMEFGLRFTTAGLDAVVDKFLQGG